MSSYLIKCNNDGTFEVNGKSGSDITLPSCDPIGCDPADLDQFNIKLYRKSDGCRKGHVEVNGVMLENSKNVCYRKCGENAEVRSTKKIKCLCNFAERSCDYLVFGSKELGWVNWKTKKVNGKAFIPTDQCPATTDEPPTEPPTVPPTQPPTKEPTQAPESECSAGPPLSTVEIDAGVTSDNVNWSCTNGHEHGSVCTKTCAEGFVFHTQYSSNTEQNCRCSKGQCLWKRSVGTCHPAVCHLSGLAWPTPVSCFDKLNNRLDWETAANPVTGIGFPEGAYCKQECNEYGVYTPWGEDVSTCQCGYKPEICKFNSRKLTYCLPGVCRTDTASIFAEFALGFDNDLSNVRNVLYLCSMYVACM